MNPPQSRGVHVAILLIPKGRPILAPRTDIMKRRSRRNKQPFSGLTTTTPAEGLKVISFNIEGFSKEKAALLTTHGADVICLQETHRDVTPPSYCSEEAATLQLPSREASSATPKSIV